MKKCYIFRLDYNHQITRTEYKPIDINEKGDPFDGKNGFVYQIDDFNTGLSYTISADYGNCSVDYLSGPDETGTVININGHIHMHNPFFTMNIDKFAFNGVVKQLSLLCARRIRRREKQFLEGYGAIMYARHQFSSTCPANTGKDSFSHLLILLEPVIAHNILLNSEN